MMFSCRVWDLCFLGAQLPPPPPSVLTDWEISMRDWIPVYQHKTYVWRFGGKPPLCWGFCCNADRTSLPSPACRGSCGLVLALATTSEEFGSRQRALGDGWRHSRDSQSPAPVPRSADHFAFRSATNHRRGLSMMSLTVSVSGLARSQAWILGGLDWGSFKNLVDYLMLDQMCPSELHCRSGLSPEIDNYSNTDCMTVIPSIKGVFPQNVKRKFYKWKELESKYKS